MSKEECNEESHFDHIDYELIEEELIKWGEMMDRHEQDELNNHSE